MVQINSDMDVDDLYFIVQYKAIEDIRVFNNLPENEKINPEEFKQDYLNFFDRRAREYVYRLFAEKSKNDVHTSTTDLVICYENLMEIIEFELKYQEDHNEDELTF